MFILSVLSVEEFYLSITSDIHKLGAFAQTTADQNNRQIDLQDNRPKATAGNISAYKASRKDIRCRKLSCKYTNQQSDLEQSEGRSSNAVRVWMPIAVTTSAITFVIAFIMRITQEQTISPFC